jgi:hypothetical protein
MRLPLVLALLAFWFFLAYRALQAGDSTRAMVFVAIGLALTAYRLRSRPASS